MTQAAVASPEQRKSGFFKKFFGFITLLITIIWALIEYLLPDPLIYFYSIWRPEYVLVLVTALVFMFSMSIFVWTYLKNKYLFFIAAFTIYIFSSFAFFVIGREYYSASYMEGAPSVTLEKGSLYYRGIEFEHVDCDRKGDTVACNFIVHNSRNQAEVSLAGWKVVMKDGAIFTDYKAYRGGQESSRFSGLRLDLPQGASAEISIVFYEVPSKYAEILNIGFSVSGRKELNFKNININR